jgi:hypothetical protein
MNFLFLYLYSWAGIFKQSRGARNRIGIGLSYRFDNPIPPRFIAPIDFLKIPAQATQAGGIHSLESIPG